MATIKSYTDLEQSRKLAEILPLESADMYYTPSLVKGHPSYFPHLKRKFPIDWDIERAIPCWSLAALLDIIKKLVGYSLQSLDTHTVFMSCELGDKPYTLETKNYDNPVDVCYEMIIKLNELNLL